MKNEEKLKRKIFQPTEENDKKINMICEATGISISELINSLFDAIGNGEEYVIAYNNAKESYRQRLRCIMATILSTDTGSKEDK